MNPHLFQGDNGRVLGYDNAHGYHHKHFRGVVTPMDYESFEDIEIQFQKEFEVIYAQSQKNKTTLPVIVTSETLESFFLRGRKIAQKIDQKIAPLARRVISFEDTKDLINFLTQNKLKLVATLRKQPCSVSGLASTSSHLTIRFHIQASSRCQTKVNFLIC